MDGLYLVIQHSNRSAWDAMCRELVVEVWLAILVWVVLVSAMVVDIVFVIHVLSSSLRMSFGFNSVIFFHTLGLCQSIGFGTGKAS